MATALINIIEMDLKRFSFARQFLPATGAAVAMAFLAGCATMSLTNLTPSSLPENPSGIYTFTLSATPEVRECRGRHRSPPTWSWASRPMT